MTGIVATPPDTEVPLLPVGLKREVLRRFQNCATGTHHIVADLLPKKEERLKVLEELRTGGYLSSQKGKVLCPVILPPDNEGKVSGMTVQLPMEIFDITWRGCLALSPLRKDETND